MGPATNPAARGPRPRRRRTSYRQRWLDTWLVASAAGVGFSFLIWDPVTVALAWVLCTAGLTAILVLTFPTTTAGDTAPPKVVLDVRWALPAAAELTTGGIAVLTFLAVTPGAAAIVALIAVASSPWSVRLLRRNHRHTGTECLLARQTHVDPVDVYLPPAWTATPDSIPWLTDAELCSVWRRSYATLIAASSPAKRLQVVVLRHMCLQEMDRRNPRAVESWLASGPRAADAPEAYLTQRPPHEPSPG